MFTGTGRNFWVRTIQALIALLVLLNAAYYTLRPDLGVLARGLRSRSSHCSIVDLFKAAVDYGGHAWTSELLHRNSRLLRQDPAGFEQWETSSGRFWLPAGDIGSLEEQLAEQKRMIYGAWAGAVHRGDIVLDCGAHVGVFTREAFAAGARLVVAIEPAPENIACLRRNVGGEIDAGRVLVYEKGVWDKDDLLTISVNPHASVVDGFVMKWEDSYDGPRVPLTTIDKLVQELQLDRVDFIKMDIEGAEQRAVAGARQTLARFKPRMALSVYHLPDDREKIPQLVRQAQPGYRVECGPCAGGFVDNFPGVLYFR